MEKKTNKYLEQYTAELHAALQTEIMAKKTEEYKAGKFLNDTLKSLKKTEKLMDIEYHREMVENIVIRTGSLQGKMM